MENNNVIYAPPFNVVEVATPTPTPTIVVVCAGCRKIYPSLEALIKDHMDTQVNRTIGAIVSACGTCVHVSSSSSPAPPRGSDAPTPRILRGGGVHHLIPCVKIAEVIHPLPDYVNDRSGRTQDLLSRVNLNPSGSAPRPNFAQPNNVDLDLKLWSMQGFELGLY